MATPTKKQLLDYIQKYINENWESIDKEGMLIEVLEELGDINYLTQIIRDQDMGTVVDIDQILGD